MRGVFADGFRRAVFTAPARAVVVGVFSALRLTGAGFAACTFFTQAGGNRLALWVPYRGAVAGRLCGPHLPLLDLRAAGFGWLPAFFAPNCFAGWV